MDGGWKLLDLVLTMHLCLGSPRLLEILFLVPIDVADLNWVELTGLPVDFGGLGAKDVRVRIHLFLVVLQVPIRHDVVVSLSANFDVFASDSLRRPT